MRIGYAPSAEADARTVVAAAHTAEEAGFHEIWLPEDYCERGVFAVAGAVAACTSTIAIGIGVINPWTRHPVLIAMEAAALDELAGGRLLLGIGASNERWMSAWLGIPFRKPITRTREAIEVIRALLAGDHVSRDFGDLTLDTALSFTPMRSGVPIYVGAKGRHALATAGTHADGLLLSILSAPSYVSWARQRAGRPEMPMGVYVLFACGADGRQVRERVKPNVAKYLGVHGDHDITRIAGLDPELCQRFRARLLEGDPASDLVTDDILDTFAIVGDPEQCAEGLLRYHAAGADTVVLIGDPGSAPAEAVTAVRLAARAGLLDEPGPSPEPVSNGVRAINLRKPS
jgi:5,10-methylenetetrahydromethanopterin reductase